MGIPILRKSPYIETGPWNLTEVAMTLWTVLTVVPAGGWACTSFLSSSTVTTRRVPVADDMWGSPTRRLADSTMIERGVSNMTVFPDWSSVMVLICGSRDMTTLRGSGAGCVTGWTMVFGGNGGRVRPSAASYKTGHIDGLVQKRQNSRALAVESCLSCTKPTICWLD